MLRSTVRSYSSLCAQNTCAPGTQLLYIYTSHHRTSICTSERYGQKGPCFNKGKARHLAPMATSLKDLLKLQLYKLQHNTRQQQQQKILWSTRRTLNVFEAPPPRHSKQINKNAPTQPTNLNTIDNMAVCTIHLASQLPSTTQYVVKQASPSELRKIKAKRTFGRPKRLRNQG